MSGDSRGPQMTIRLSRFEVDHAGWVDDLVAGIESNRGGDFLECVVGLEVFLSDNRTGAGSLRFELAADGDRECPRSEEHKPSKIDMPSDLRQSDNRMAGVSNSDTYRHSVHGGWLHAVQSHNTVCSTVNASPRSCWATGSPPGTISDERRRRVALHESGAPQPPR